MTLGALIAEIVYVWFIPGLFTLIFITFLWGSFMYYIAGGPDEEAKEKGKAVIMYALLSFFGLSVFYAIAKMVEGIVM